MKHISWCLILLFLSSAPVFGQDSGPLKIEKEGFKISYYYDGVRLEKQEAKDYLRTNPASASKYNDSKAFGVAAITLASGVMACAVVSLYYMGSSFISLLDCNGKAGSELMRSAYWDLAGSACVLGSIACGFSYRKSLDRSVKLYNDAIRPQGYNNSIKVYLGVTENGIGMSVIF